MSPQRKYLEDDPLWYKDAVIYELHVKAYRDSNGDGIGDFKGLIQKLDYLQELGVTVVWILPFYPSPLKDDGYDIADYNSIHPWYGQLSDFKEFLKQAHRRGIRVITEVVLNHTSDQHPWFQRAREAKKGSKHRDYYVWSDTPEKYSDARIIFGDFENSNWKWDPIAKQYYWHRFYSHQPDLNFESRQVQKDVLNVVDYWLGMGVDGLRLDAIPYLYEREGTNCENLPETHEFIKKLRARVDRKFKNKMLLAEANQWAEDTMLYFGDGDECHMAFNFPLMPRMYMALQMEDRYPIIDILDPPLDIPDSCQWGLFLRNHDELTLEMVTDEERDYMYRFFARDPRAKINLGIRRRLAPLLSNNRKRIELLNILLFSLPGTPIIYYGDEIGMGDNYHLGDRDGVRTPMQWGPDRNAGFSMANPQKLYLPLIIDPEYHFEVVNVENQERNPSSLLWWMKRVIAMRKKYKAFGRGDIKFLSPRNHKVLAFTRSFKDETILVVINLSRYAQPVELDLSEYAGSVPVELFSQNRFSQIKDNSYPLTMGPHSHFWFLLTKGEPEYRVNGDEGAPEISVIEVGDILQGKSRERFEKDCLVPYFKKARWFGGKARSVNKMEIVDSVQAFKKKHAPFARLLLVEVSYFEGAAETYLVPIMYAEGDKAHQIKSDSPRAVIAKVETEEGNGVLYDATFDPAFRLELYEVIKRRMKLKGREAEIVPLKARRFNRLASGSNGDLDTRLMGVEQSNSSIVYGDLFVLKLFRKLGEGVHTDAEILRALTEKTDFEHIPKFAGALEYRREGKAPMTAGLLQDYAPNQGDAWAYFLDNVSKFFETVLTKWEREAEPPCVPFLPWEESEEEDKVKMRELVGGFFSEMVSLFGKRTGELHLALASITDDPAFSPESFSTLYQRSVHQSMRGLTRQVFRTLDKSMSDIPKDLKKEAEAIINAQNRIIYRFQKIVGKKIQAQKIRIHGDYHLGQVLYTGKDFVIIDFEGEPSRALSERRLKRSALRDVAGIIRSFHYAINAGLLRHPQTSPEENVFLESWIKPWYNFVSNTWLEAYLSVVEDGSIVPKKKEDFTTLLDAFLLEKAVYELGYELNNRPDWVKIPLRGIKYILRES